ncbi:MAG: phosphoglycerate kinase [Gammaproteobacteria bacterium]|jgi:phosphoglycerate kinase|tara:strand:- start:7358 stop:8515 length:1158 start_codon:yes stop_codon:yes gene_type:complete
MLQMRDLPLARQRLLIRQDLNVPLSNGKISDNTRLKAVLDTIAFAHNSGATVMIMSHLGRPKEGSVEPLLSLKPIASALSVLLEMPVNFAEDWIEGFEAQAGSITLFENVRFLKGEQSNDEELAKKMASLCDIFVNDAFATAHRAHASTHGVAKYASIACSGPLLTAEITALNKALENPKRPLVAVVGGAKVSTKLEIIQSLLGKVDSLIVGGGIANTCLKASGKSIGASLCENDMIETAEKIIKDTETNIPLPIDVVCGKTFAENEVGVRKKICEVSPDDMILDLGEQSLQQIEKIILNAGTILWNGPLGVFEFPNFAQGTKKLAQAIAKSEAFSIAGGGDTLSAITSFKVGEKISYISTGGGAFLEFVEGKTLPAIAMLESRS